MHVTSIYQPVPATLTKIKLCAQFLEAAASIFAGLHGDAFLEQAQARVLLLFGPSPLRPLEVYDIMLDEAPERVSTAAADSSEASRSLVRRVLRELISSAADTSEGGAVRGKRDSLLPGNTFGVHPAQVRTAHGVWLHVVRQCQPLMHNATVMPMQAPPGSL